MNRVELEQAVIDIMAADMELLFDFGFKEIVKRVSAADTETLEAFLKEASDNEETN